MHKPLAYTCWRTIFLIRVQTTFRYKVSMKLCIHNHCIHMYTYHSLVYIFSLFKYLEINCEKHLWRIRPIISFVVVSTSIWKSINTKWLQQWSNVYARYESPVNKSRKVTHYLNKKIKWSTTDGCSIQILEPVQINKIIFCRNLLSVIIRFCQILEFRCFHKPSGATII